MKPKVNAQVLKQRNRYLTHIPMTSFKIFIALSLKTL